MSVLDNSANQVENDQTETSYLLSTNKSTYNEKSKSNKKNDPIQRNLGTFDGVFLPVSLNVLSILMFLRFGFIIGQMGILGTMGLLILSYSIDILTTLSISAISTNGTVKGGGAYYMISRSLGPEFGGAIGIIFVIGQILNSSLNVVGFIEPLLVNFGYNEGDLYQLLPTGYVWNVFYSTILLSICTIIAMVGSSLISKTAFFLFIILTISTLSIPISTLFVKPYYPLEPPFNNILYTGLSWKTWLENLYPKFTSGAAGSVLPPDQHETVRDMFGIFFPATAGILAGASMSGELKNPSKSIPNGTLKGLFVTFLLYSLVILSMGAAIPRDLLHVDIKVIQTVNLSSSIIIAGEFSTSLFSVIMGIVGAATMINAIADDKIIPGLSIFTTSKKSSTDKKKAQIYSIIAVFFIAQIFLFSDINQIATFITMAFLMTFIVTNIACFLLRLGSAPNFRPSFKYFSTRTAGLGAMVCFIAMFIVDGISATLVLFCLTVLILLIHYSTPPSKFGDISQLLIYHQVRKYLLRLKLEMSVKYWRPQILLLCDNPRTSWNLIGFCNHLKKGGLYVLGHVVLMNDDTNTSSNNDKNSSVFSASTYQEVRKQKQAWVKTRDMSKIKAFVQIALGPTLPWGVRNVYLGSGLGGMRPNITVLGFYDFEKHGIEMPVIPKSFDSSDKCIDQLPTDYCRKEKKVSINQWVQIVEDLIILQATVAVAANFKTLKLPKFTHSNNWFTRKRQMLHHEDFKYIDLYPIQMSSINQLKDGQSVLSTNFDTYTLILQLGSILSTTDEWNLTNHKVRVIVFVEFETEINDENERLNKLLSSLRIDAEIKIICLELENLDSYNYMIKGFTKQNQILYNKVDNILCHDQWWKNLCKARSTLREIEKRKTLKKQKSKVIPLSKSSSRVDLPETFQTLGLSSTSPPQLLGQSLKNPRRYTLSGLHDQGMSLSFKYQGKGGDFLYDDEYSEASEEDDDSDYLRSISSTITLNKSGMKSPDQVSIRSSVSNLRPNFSSVKIPKINDEEEDGDADEDEEEGTSRGRHTIKFKEQDEEEQAITTRPSLRSKSRQKSSLIVNDDEVIKHISTPQFLIADDDLIDPPKLSLNSPLSSAAHYARKSQYTSDKTITKKQLQEELKSLTFNGLPAKGQHIVLNELMLKHSVKDKTDVIFSTLPAPSMGTHLHDNDAFEYTNNLAIWMENLPPVLLVNSQTVTVTTAL
ncbi:unnamed protein product [Candida verbasci]|uniref:Amino acid permease/ SLC12A domain-containing protein n=1 Tax=Candida verbasci TaxID=1227364 RepID=A0A9W4XA88_9ASCO|nr:unnamed protein product [Candida verbasci]